MSTSGILVLTGLLACSSETTQQEDGGETESAQEGTRGEGSAGSDGTGGASETDGGQGSETTSSDPGETTENGDADLAVTFTRAPDSGTNEAASWFEYEAPDADGYTCSLDGITVEDCDGASFVVPMTLGAHAFEATAWGEAGASGETATHEWEVVSVFEGEHDELAPTTNAPAPVDENGWRGIFRINCDFSHSSYNDPIVFPGESDAAHLHRFYGNMNLDHTSSMASLYEAADSSCQGNTLNGAAYWVPALLAPSYDEVTGERLLDGDGEPAWEVVPAVVGNNDVAHELFYYSAGVDDLDTIQNIPPGLRMIAGDAMTLPAGDSQDTSIVRWHCQSWEANDATNPNFSATIPECAEPDRLRMDIFFPSCWNGADLDSEDHKSHMAYPVNDGGPSGTHCPETHPVPLLRPSYHYAWPVLPGNSDPATTSSLGWRLASDHYEVQSNQPGGLSLHGDWFNAWHPEILDTVLENCVKAGLDCHDGNLANGTRLSGTQPGSQEVPPIVDQGRGYP